MSPKRILIFFSIFAVFVFSSTTLAKDSPIRSEDLIKAFKSYVTTIPPVTEVAVAAPTNLNEESAFNFSSSGVTKAELTEALRALLKEKEFASQLRGPAGQTGQPGKEGKPAPISLNNVQGPIGYNFGTTLPANNYGNSTVGVLGGFASLGAQNFTATTINGTGSTTLANLVVSGGATITGSLSVTGNITGALTSTSTTSPLVLGGTSTTQDLTFQTTSGVGATGADMHFLVGNNGATEALTILNSGNVGIGTATPTAKLHTVGSAIFQQTTEVTGSELVTNGTFTGSAAGWTLQSGCATYGSNSVTVLYDAACQADADFPAVSTEFETVAGNTYQLSYAFTAGNAPTCIYFDENDLDVGCTGAETAPGSYLFIFTATYTGTDTLWFDDYNYDDGDTWTLDNVSIIEVTLPTFQVKGHDSATVFLLGGDTLNNISIGKSSLYSNTAGTYNVANGYNALYSNTTGRHNVATGYKALYSNTTGSNNIATGGYSLQFNTTGSWNVASGLQSLYQNTTGSENTAVGAQVLYNNTTGTLNSAVGSNSLYGNTTGYDNTAVGVQSLYTNTTGYQNTAIGKESLRANSTGIYNTGVGYRSLASNTTGNENTANGYQSLQANSTGISNTATGSLALRANTSGSYNVSNGFQSLYNNTAGGSNTAIGSAALAINSTGSRNVALGYSAGFYETGSDSFYIDNRDRGSTANDKAGALLYGTFNATPDNQVLTVNANLKIAGTAIRTGPGSVEGTHHLDIFDGTAPVGTLANGISLYSTAGELRVMDAAGNATLLSPHENVNNYWVFDSANAETGKTIIIDMEEMMKKLNDTFGWDYVHETVDGVERVVTTNPNLTLEGIDARISALEAIGGTSSFGGLASSFFNTILTSVENGMAYMKGLVVETLKVGSPQKRTGVTLYDEITGDPYCLSVANGVQKTTSGECITIEAAAAASVGSSSGSPEPVVEYVPEPIVEETTEEIIPTEGVDGGSTPEITPSADGGQAESTPEPASESAPESAPAE